MKCNFCPNEAKYFDTNKEQYFCIKCLKHMVKPASCGYCERKLSSVDEAFYGDECQLCELCYLALCEKQLEEDKYEGSLQWL